MTQANGYEQQPVGAAAVVRCNAADAKVNPFRPPKGWHDPLRLIEQEEPGRQARIVLWTVSVLVLFLILWAAIGKLDIIATADGKLVTHTLVKIVQPAEAGVIRQLQVHEGDTVKAGQVLARLDSTVAHADRSSVASELGMQHMQARRLEAELADQSMLPKAEDDPALFAQVHAQYLSHRKAYIDSLEQEQSLLSKAGHERKSALEVLRKLEQTLPTYKRAAEAFARLEKEGFYSGIAAAEKQREAIEKTKDLDAQQATVAALDASIAAQQKRISQIRSTYRSELQKELTDARARIAQLQPALDKSVYRESLMELKAPQDGVIKDVATTTLGAVVQPGSVVMTLVPRSERLYADVAIKNEDVGFVQAGQRAQIKIATYPFHKYGMLTGKVIHVGADAMEPGTAAGSSARPTNEQGTQALAGLLSYKARIELDSQVLADRPGTRLLLWPGMQVIAEINQGERTVLEYLLSPVLKTVSEAARER